MLRSTLDVLDRFTSKAYVPTSRHGDLQLLTSFTAPIPSLNLCFTPFQTHSILTDRPNQRTRFSASSRHSPYSVLPHLLHLKQHQLRSTPHRPFLVVQLEYHGQTTRRMKMTTPLTGQGRGRQPGAHLPRQRRAYRPLQGLESESEPSLSQVHPRRRGPLILPILLRTNLLRGVPRQPSAQSPSFENPSRQSAKLQHQQPTQPSPNRHGRHQLLRRQRRRRRPQRLSATPTDAKRAQTPSADSSIRWLPMRGGHRLRA